MLFLGAIFSALGIILFVIGERFRSIQAEMRSVKRMLIRELRPGIITEISGTAQLDPPLLTPFSNQPCVYYEYEVQRYEPKVHGKSVWRRVWQEQSAKRFHIYDGTGDLSVTPVEASIDVPQVYESLLQAGDVYSQKPAVKKLVNLIAGYQARVIERALLIGASVYVFGSVFSNDEKMYMMKGKRPLIISTKPEELVEQEIGRKGALFTLGGLIGLCGGLALIVLQYFVL
ncbi:MAG: GIDE domain-containing protein [Parcubacteria group bacterium]